MYNRYLKKKENVQRERGTGKGVRGKAGSDK